MSTAVVQLGDKIRQILNSQIPANGVAVQVKLDESIAEAFEYDGMTDAKIAANVLKMQIAIGDRQATDTMVTAGLQISFVMPRLNAKKAAKLRAGSALVTQVFDTLTQYQLTPAWLRRVFASEAHSMWTGKYAARSAIASAWPSWIDQSWLAFAYSGAICCFYPEDRPGMLEFMTLFAAITSVIYSGGLQDAQKKEAKQKELDEYVSALAKFGSWAKSRSIVAIQVYSSANGQLSPPTPIVPGSGQDHFKRWLYENKVTQHPEYVDVKPSVSSVPTYQGVPSFVRKTMLTEYQSPEIVGTATSSMTSTSSSSGSATPSLVIVPAPTS